MKKMKDNFAIKNLIKSHLSSVVISFVILIYGIFAFVLPSQTQTLALDGRQATSYNELLVPTADPASQLTVGGYLLTFPVGFAGHLAFCLSDRATVLLTGGILGFPPGFLASPALRMHLWRPSSRNWGLAVQAQSGIGVVLSGGGGSGGIFNALELVASSPIRPTRVHFGVVLHTMPGSEFKPGWQRAKKYDVKNPQTTLFVAGEYSFKKTTLSTELIWIAPGADDGWDSALAGLIGVNFSFGRTELKVGTGVFTYRFGSGNPNTLPAPPVIVLTRRF